ncbi:hypothetical protein KIPB_004872 [Kipferlia bialata]|uniref:UDP-N-acetylglucosamine transferase subunit ALG13 n=1 Tax=Kipferlia bialata TaxID=797122 RepID=A0A9K3GIL1_9EUKA|nr:hypothetical protein KIPB_004872 [Kipferlia bialata]|eukprot:g4872.t1
MSPSPCATPHMHIFVSVGTTRFDAMLEVLQDPQILANLKELGYDTMTIQHGKGDPMEVPEGCPLSIQQISMTSQFEREVSAADLVISHAGAGTILEVRDHSKKHIVVCNPSLMNNHQLELVDALNKEHTAIGVASPEELRELMSGLGNLALRIQLMSRVRGEGSKVRSFGTILMHEAGLI